MAWIGIEDGDLPFVFRSQSEEYVRMQGSIVICDGPVNPPDFQILFGGPSPRMRFTFLQYYASVPSEFSDSEYGPAYVWGYAEDGDLYIEVANQAPLVRVIESPSIVEYFDPSPAELAAGYDEVGLNPAQDLGGNAFYSTDRYRVLVEIWTDTPPTPTPSYDPRSLVYEAERGWSFDGKYIPHYLELNWLFNEDPFTYHEMQKVRIHGLTKGNVDLQVAMSGMQGDNATDYLEDYTEPQFIDLPFTPIHISEEYKPTTNYTDVVSRGIGIQMKFEGRNTDVTLPEPAHAIQVLALQASPQGNGKRAN